jgi:hypothetical protein
MLGEASHAEGQPQYAIRPLRTLTGADRCALVERLYRSDQRFARAFYTYWHEVIGQPAQEAQTSTAAELAQYADAILKNPNDPHVHCVSLDRDGQHDPIGIFAFRPLEEHSQGQILESHLRFTGQRARYDGRLAIAHAVALLDEHATRMAFNHILLAIAHKSLSGGFSFVFFYTSDDRLVPLYRRYGMEFPPDLRFPHTAHVVGVYEPARPENVTRMCLVAQRCGAEFERFEHLSVRSAP